MNSKKKHSNLFVSPGKRNKFANWSLHFYQYQVYLDVKIWTNKFLFLFNVAYLTLMIRRVNPM